MVTRSIEDDARSFGTPITLAELRELGEFPRWQDLNERVAGLIAARRLPMGYPLIPTRLPANAFIDLCVNWRWQKVKFLREEGSAMGGDHRIVFQEDGAERALRYDWHGVAPAGYFTDWRKPSPASFEGAKLLETFELAQNGHVIHTQSLESVDWPYLTFEAVSFHPKARWVERENMWTGSYTVHAADPRVHVEGIVPREPWFNTTIAVSHRWLRPDQPDPERIQHQELMKLSDELGFHETQAFLIDYCSLPQAPRTAEEQAWFQENLPGFQSQYKHVTLVLNSGAADYATRAWCMFELMLAAMSRAPRPTLLNHAHLDAPLRAARDLAAGYLKQSGWNQQGMLGAFGGGLTNQSFAKWTRDPMNVMIYNAVINGRRAIFEKFEKELDVSEPADRLLIADLLKRLAFE
jgi:hypothetical protein